MNFASPSVATTKKQTCDSKPDEIHFASFTAPFAQSVFTDVLNFLIYSDCD